MSETTDNTAEAGNQGQPAEAPESFSQEDVNRIIADRLDRERKKYERHDEYRAAFERLEAVTAERDDLAEKVRAREEQDAHAALVSEVAESTGVPASMLRGSTKEELEAHAAVLLPHLRSAVPPAPGAGVQPEATPEAAERLFVRNLFSAAKAQ